MTCNQFIDQLTPVMSHCSQCSMHQYSSTRTKISGLTQSRTRNPSLQLTHAPSLARHLPEEEAAVDAAADRRRRPGLPPLPSRQVPGRRLLRQRHLRVGPAGGGRQVRDLHRRRRQRPLGAEERGAQVLPRSGRRQASLQRQDAVRCRALVSTEGLVNGCNVSKEVWLLRATKALKVLPKYLWTRLSLLRLGLLPYLHCGCSSQHWGRSSILKKMQVPPLFWCDFQ